MHSIKEQSQSEVDRPLLQMTDVAFSWAGAPGFGLSVPDFSIASGETVLLLGDSGSGKSTLLSLICGTLLPQNGDISIANTNLIALSNGARDRFRAEHIGVIFQQFNLLPFGSVADNISLPLHFAPERRKRAEVARQKAEDLCTNLGLPPGISSAKAATLSVGQQQRVAVARALIGQPPLIIADEPTSALDAGNQTAFLDVLFAQTSQHGATLLMVSHDARLGTYFDRVVQIEDIATTKRSAA